MHHSLERLPGEAAFAVNPEWPINEVLLQAYVLRPITDRQIAALHSVPVEAVLSLRAKFRL